MYDYKFDNVYGDSISIIMLNLLFSLDIYIWMGTPLSQTAIHIDNILWNTQPFYN